MKAVLIAIGIILALMLALLVYACIVVGGSCMVKKGRNDPCRKK